MIERKYKQGKMAIASEVKTTYQLLEGINAQKINPRELNVYERRLLVEHLVIDGFITPDIAKILNVSEPTICKDRRAIKKGFALYAKLIDPDVYVGMLQKKTEGRVARLRRILGDKKRINSLTVSEITNLERQCHQIEMDMAKLLVGIGKIPPATIRVESKVESDINITVTEEQARAEVEEITNRLAKSGIEVSYN